MTNSRRYEYEEEQEDISSLEDGQVRKQVGLGVEEEEEQFFESVDRIVSCSSSSCSSDNDEGGPPRNPDYASSSPDQIPPPIRFPMAAVSMYDVWIAEPASVHERRHRLLSQLGLASDKTLARVGSSLATSPSPPPQDRRSACADIAAATRRSASCDQLVQGHQDSSNSRIARSSSDGASTSNRCTSNPFPLNLLPRNSAQFDASSLSVHSNHQFAPFSCLSKNGSSNGSSPAPCKPPSGKFSRRSDEIKAADQLNSNSPYVTATTSPNESHRCHPDDVDGSDSASGDPDQRAYTIKNLDNGEEFVVNEIGEDGVWNKLREVGTGRQLTREEFEMCVVGHSPIVQELMRRENVEESSGRNKDSTYPVASDVRGPKSKKKGGWFKSIKSVASSVTGHHRERRSSDEKDTSSEKGGRRSSSATDDSQDVLSHPPEKTKVRYYGKSCKELSALYMSQEIQAHNGSIWTIKFSLDGQYLASAGQDRVIHIWQVTESERRGDLLAERMDEGNTNPFSMVSGSPEPTSKSANGDWGHSEKKKRGKLSYTRKSMNLDHVVVPENVFAFSERPICSLQGHLADVLDLCWSKSEHLLSSSMDKTVRLWHMSSKSCLKVFSHSDYVTCIQFNPVDDRYFISGSLDAKVRIWSIPDRQVVDWNDLREMVTAACYTPDGQGALVGSHKGSCHLYNTSDNKLHQKSQINLQNKKKKSHVKKITGFQFTPGSSSEVLVTSADSRIRVVDGVDLVHKFKGFRNTSSQISAALTTNGKYIVCASEDSHVYVWRYDNDSRPSRGKGVSTTRSYEHFHCRDVSVAVPWPGMIHHPQEGEQNQRVVSAINSLEPAEVNGHQSPSLSYGCESSPLHPSTVSGSNGSFFSDKVSVTWPEEKLLMETTTIEKRISQSNGSYYSGRSAWGMVVVTAGLGGEIKTFQNFGLPMRI